MKNDFKLEATFTAKRDTFVNLITDMLKGGIKSGDVFTINSIDGQEKVNITLK